MVAFACEKVDKSKGHLTVYSRDNSKKLDLNKVHSGSVLNGFDSCHQIDSKAF